jgi:hypothetical protein
MARAWTEKFILSRIRATLRRLSMQMPAIRECKLRARRAYTAGVNPRQKFEYACALCHEYFPEKETQVDHVEPAGSLQSFDDVGPFARRLLFPPQSGLRCLCLACHNRVTQEQRRAAREARKLKKSP